VALLPQKSSGTGRSPTEVSRVVQVLPGPERKGTGAGQLDLRWSIIFLIALALALTTHTVHPAGVGSIVSILLQFENPAVLDILTISFFLGNGSNAGFSRGRVGCVLGLRKHT